MEHLVQKESLGSNVAIFSATDIKPSLDAVVNIGRILEGLSENVVGTFGQNE
jgi:hypothetical protein